MDLREKIRGAGEYRANVENLRYRRIVAPARKQHRDRTLMLTAVRISME
jgi:hypothetical protein